MNKEVCCHPSFAWEVKSWIWFTSSLYVAKCISTGQVLHKNFLQSLWWEESEFDENTEIIVPLSVWIQHKQKGLPIQNKCFEEVQGVWNVYPRAPRSFALYLAGMTILVLSFSAHVFLLQHLIITNSQHQNSYIACKHDIKGYYPLNV